MMVMLLTWLPAALPETLEERLHRLEAEVQALRSTLSQQQAQQKQTVAAPEVVPATPSVQPASAATQSTAHVRYYIQDDPLGVQPPSDHSALAGGWISDPDELSFDPGAYDVAGVGLFSSYRDPAAYRYVGLALQGDLTIDELGEYELVVYPKPARDGGTNVLTRLSLRLSIGEELVVSFQDERSWRPQRNRVMLTPGQYRLRLWAVAASDGFGPSPTESRFRLALKGPNDASPHPLRRLRAPLQPD